MLENGTKFKDSLSLYKKFVVGSNYLKNYILENNQTVNEYDICVIPTCVDYESYRKKNYNKIFSQEKIVLGWIGSNGNLDRLESIIPQINEVHKTKPVKLVIISGRQVEHNVNFEIENIMWSYETQIEDLLKMDIGLMPINNTLEDMGKCGFKLIQYMGLGIVSIASAITVNKEIIDEEINGFLVEPDEDWFRKLLKILDSRDEFERIGNSARKKIEENYSFLANKDRYIKFIEELKSKK
jgi:glycosyltransferase involved in cell wall biosynthesis